MSVDDEAELQEADDEAGHVEVDTKVDGEALSLSGTQNDTTETDSHPSLGAATETPLQPGRFRKHAKSLANNGLISSEPKSGVVTPMAVYTPSKTLSAINSQRKRDEAVSRRSATVTPRFALTPLYTTHRRAQSCGIESVVESVGRRRLLSTLHLTSNLPMPLHLCAHPALSPLIQSSSSKLLMMQIRSSCSILAGFSPQALGVRFVRPPRPRSNLQRRLSNLVSYFQCIT